MLTTSRAVLYGLAAVICAAGAGCAGDRSKVNSPPGNADGAGSSAPDAGTEQGGATNDGGSSAPTPNAPGAPFPGAPGSPGGTPDAGAPPPGDAAHGATRWATALPDSIEASVVSDPDGILFVTGASGAVNEKTAGLRLTELDASGNVLLARDYGSGCGVGGKAVGVTAAGHLLVDVASSCSQPAAGLGPDPVTGGTVVELARNGDFVRQLVRDVGGPLSGGTAAMAPDGSLFTAFRDNLQKLDANGAKLWSTSVTALAGTPLGPMQDDGVVLPNFLASTSASVPDELERFGPDGNLLWRTPMPGSVYGLAVVSDGGVAVLEQGPTGTKFLEVVNDDGTSRARTDTGLPDARVLTALPGGGLVLAYDRIEQDRRCPFLRVYSAVLAQEWDRALDPNCNALVADVTVTPQQQIIVVGALGGAADFGGGHVLTPTEASVGFVVSVTR